MLYILNFNFYTMVNEETDTVIFYLYNDKGELRDFPDTWTCIVPWSAKKINPQTNKYEFDSQTLKKCRFKNGKYETNDKEEIEFLSLYNEWNPMKRVLSNWTRFTRNNFPIISTINPSIKIAEKENIKEIVKEVEVIKEINVLEYYVAEMLTVKALEEIAAKNDVIIPENITKKEDILNFLVENKIISKNNQ